nr:MAG TPA: hypothetical protein [Caudoviricetes sp.]
MSEILYFCDKSITIKSKSGGFPLRANCLSV